MKFASDNNRDMSEHSTTNEKQIGYIFIVTDRYLVRINTKLCSSQNRWVILLILFSYL